MEDMISRKALCEYALNQKDKSITPNDIMRFPSAQPETHEERTETHACDCISRQAAIDAITRKMVSIPTAGEKDLMGDVNRIRAEDISVIRRLPSTKPEIIRCRECKFYTEIRPDLNTGICNLACRHLGGDGFCSDAERKTDE